jgi:hypothetical protein
MRTIRNIDEGPNRVREGSLRTRVGSVSLCALIALAAACSGTSDGGADDAGVSDTSASHDAGGSGLDAGAEDGSLGEDGASPAKDGASSAVDAGDAKGAPRDAAIDGASADAADPADADAADAATMPDAKPSDAGTSIDAGPPVDGGTCNAIANVGGSVPELRIAADAPAPQGGTLVIGTYALTRWEVYTGTGGVAGPTGNTRRHTMQFATSRYEEATADNGQGDEHFTRTWSTQGTFFTSQQLCPTVDNLGDDYTATATTLTLQASGVVFTLTRQ